METAIKRMKPNTVTPSSFTIKLISHALVIDFSLWNSWGKVCSKYPREAGGRGAVTSYSYLKLLLPHDKKVILLLTNTKSRILDNDLQITVFTVRVLQ